MNRPSKEAMEAVKELLAAGNLVRRDEDGLLINALPIAAALDAFTEQRVQAANDFWLTSVYGWDPTPGTDAIYYVLYGRATRTPEEARQVYEMVEQARARAGVAMAREDAAHVPQV